MASCISAPRNTRRCRSPCFVGRHPAERARWALHAVPRGLRRGQWGCSPPAVESRPAVPRPHRRAASRSPYSSVGPVPTARAPTAPSRLLERQRSVANRALALVCGTSHNGRCRYRSVARWSCARFPADIATRSDRRPRAPGSYTAEVGARERFRPPAWEGVCSIVDHKPHPACAPAFSDALFACPERREPLVACWPAGLLPTAVSAGHFLLLVVLVPVPAPI